MKPCLNKKHKRGVSMAEAIVAMLIIIAVSITAIGFMQRYSFVSAKMVNRNEALTIADNCLNSFKYAENLSEFNIAISIVNDIRFTVNGSEYRFDKIDRYTTVRESDFQEVMYSIRMYVNYYNDYATFSIYTTDTNGDIIVQIVEYRKALGNYS